MTTAPPIPISYENARLLHIEVENELERICSAVHFRTSKRACEFLRYVVRVTLDGRLDSLKERSIGIDLLGREISYDPSSDAIVRVRANDVRKRLSSYYATADVASQVQINLPTGTYVPNFLPGVPVRDVVEAPSYTLALTRPMEETKEVQPLNRLALMRPALIATLLCVLLMRHRLEDRESYLRFWDHILDGRNGMLLSIAPKAKANLAFSLYPVAWMAGRYGVDVAIDDSLTPNARPGRFASLQESLTTPAAIAEDQRLRWTVVAQATGENAIADREAAIGLNALKTSAALLTIRPENPAAIYIDGTDKEVIDRLLEDLTSQKNFPEAIIDQLGSRHVLQVLLLRNAAGEWQTEIFSGDQ
jgi:hypothetical protein